VTPAAATIELPYLPPYDWPAILSHLGARAIEGVELVVGCAYRRTVEEDGATGTVEVVDRAAHRCLAVTIRFPAARAVPRIVGRVRRVFDLDADVTAIGAHLANDPLLAPLVARRPGLRVPGGWDGFELAVRAVLGQQITVQAARGLARQLVRLCGTRLRNDVSADPVLALGFPGAEEVARADLSAIGMPASRRATLRAVAEAALADPRLFERRATIEETVARLRAIRGIGDWTAHYIALRASRDPDAFPASDIGLLRGATEAGARRVTAAELLARAESWRPWRAYAAQHLWSADAGRTRLRGG
jgi:AraC family transcriptional regulator of adaptative response / DNA-3-methyladenine glycosylase II